MKMKVVLDQGAYIPTRAHETDAGIDLYAMHDGVVDYSETFDTGVHVQIPEGYVGFIKSKSGLMCNHDITTDGTIDCGYTGSIRVKLFNHGCVSYLVSAGEKIAQLVLLPIITPELDLVERLDETERGDGGFGSTGKF